MQPLHQTAHTYTGYAKCSAHVSHSDVYLLEQTHIKQKGYSCTVIRACFVQPQIAPTRLGQGVEYAQSLGCLEKVRLLHDAQELFFVYFSIAITIRLVYPH